MILTTQTDLHPLLQAVERGATPGLDDFVAAFEHLFPLLGKLKDTQQDPEWHAEGDVHEHTGRVLEQTYLLLQQQAAHLSPQERFVLVLAALFHDIAKPVTTRTRIYENEERLISPGHADKGRSYIAYKLLDLGLGADTARAVMAVVGHHHDPKHLVLKDAPPATTNGWPDWHPCSCSTGSSRPTCVGASLMTWTNSSTSWSCSSLRPRKRGFGGP